MVGLRYVYMFILLITLSFAFAMVSTPSYAADPSPSSGGTNSAVADSSMNGCISASGLFAGLVITGQKIYSGLRDLIYVVAGFGIIGVAVGGFFGNLNWKWLGAIIISLVVIASTGEIVDMIIGCEGFTQKMITDSLKGAQSKGFEIFRSVRTLIFIIGGFGLVGIAYGGIFGKINWKWFAGLVVGLAVLAAAGHIVANIVGGEFAQYYQDTIEDDNKTPQTPAE